jgi:Sporulation and spore germination.
MGFMTENKFIENTGGGINSYKYASLTLYYANEAGDKLVKEVRDVHYSTNKSLEQLVVEQIIQGPQNAGNYPTVDSAVKIVSTTAKDGVCYISLDSTFLEPNYNLAASLPVYSIVNSLIDTCKVNRVQISINGQTEITYREEIGFDIFFERNMELIEGAPLQQETVTEGTDERN